ncbi:hypothetical protein KFK09_010371 [Dendrobium nobile]|uniref:Uncharacterized protein n=1 Tax=Dendrobium nobile TaxID=94219 RepID=A0A8T3BCS9_DENNO|nr:hypothetical protein KFK09_010371 [Dendrobium nobile]
MFIFITYKIETNCSTYKLFINQFINCKRVYNKFEYEKLETINYTLMICSNAPQRNCFKTLSSIMI